MGALGSLRGPVAAIHPPQAAIVGYIRAETPQAEVRRLANCAVLAGGAVRPCYRWAAVRNGLGDF